MLKNREKRDFGKLGKCIYTLAFACWGNVPNPLERTQGDPVAARSANALEHDRLNAGYAPFPLPRFSV